MIARLRDYRGALLAIAVLGAAIAIAQGADQRLRPAPVLREASRFTITPAGDDVPRLAPITVTFPSPPTERTADKLLQVEPAAGGTYTWLSARTLLFQPDFPGLLRGSTYSVHVSARPEAGLAADMTKTFTVTGQLAVQQVIPGDGDTEVPVAAPIIVQFSRAVAPLTTLAAQPTEAVIAFDPPLHGKGEWLNTSIYRFRPSDLAPATRYHLTIAKGLSTATDGVLRADFRSTFSTIQPAIDSIQPDTNWIYCGPWQQVDVTFDQPMDPSAAAGLSVQTADGIGAPGRTTWNADHTILSFNPTIRLGVQTKYVIALAKGLRGAHGGQTASARTASFTTIALPSIARTTPANGETTAGRFGVSVAFATPMDPATLEGKLHVSGFSDQDLDGRVFAGEQYLTASVALKASTAYTVTLDPGATDRYGQELGGARFSFTTGALPSSVSLALPGSTVTYGAKSEPILYYRVTNQPSVRFTLYPLTPDEGRAMFNDPAQGLKPSFAPSQPAMRTWTESPRLVKDDVVLAATSLSGGGPLPTGYYFLRTDGQLASQFAFAVVDTVIVTKLSTNELQAWVLDHNTGRPVPGTTVRAYGAGVTPDARTTDAAGLASFAVPPVSPAKQVVDRNYLLWIDGGGRTAVASTRWQNGVAPWQLGLPTEYWARDFVGQVYTDRPIYRPGEAVELKGIVRADDDAQYSLPSETAPFALVIVNARGQQVSKQGVTLNAFGSFAAHFELPADAPLGSYFLSLQQPNGTTAVTIAGNTFLVAAFRAPEFEVAVTTGRPSYVNGDGIGVQAAASFFFGGALAGAPVQWSVLAAPYGMHVRGFERYSFSDVDLGTRAIYRDPLRATGNAKTGGDGVAGFAVPAALQVSDGAQRYTVSATVNDENGQAVAGSATVTVHPAALYVGIHPAQYVAAEGRPTAVELVTVDDDGRVIGGRAVTVEVYDRQWVTTKVQVPGGGRRYDAQPRDTLLQSLSATTDEAGKASVSVRPTKAGTLRIVARIADDRGRVERSAAYLWVSGATFASWQTANEDALRLVADKEQYEVGDTAQVLVPAPFSGGTALITVERGKVITHEVRELPTNSERLAIPITDRSVPNVFVSAVLYRGPTAADPTPRFKVGYVELPVSTRSRVLNVAITPDRAAARPGDVVRYRIAVTDANGRGVKAELSVSVVDKAVVSLQDERGPDGLHAFWFERGLGVGTASSMAISADRWNDVVAETSATGKGGSGSGGGLTPDQSRQDFRNTAYWDAQVTTADDGTAVVDVPMPDNLTTWRLQARAISGDTMVGEGINELLSTQPLLLRSALPRFLRAGDTAELRFLVRNATTTASTVTLALQANDLGVTGDLNRTATVPAGQSAMVSWPAKPTTEGIAMVRVTATGTGGLADGLVLRIPVLVDLTPETMSTGGIVTNEGALEAVYLPPFADTAHGSLTVQVRSALVGTMAEELHFLDPTTREGAERVASRLIASLAVRRAQRSTGVAASVADAAIARDLAGLIGRQRPDGGWAWCDDPGCSTDPNVSGWVLLALGEARRDGLSIDTVVLARASAHVSQYANRSTDIAHPADDSQKAFLLAAQSSADGGTNTLSAVRALIDQHRVAITNWGRAYLLMALGNAGVTKDDPQVRMLLDDLATKTIAGANGNQWDDDAVPGSFVTNTGTTGLVALALARLQPDHPLLPQTVRRLVLARDADGWRTSIDRALGILSLTTYAIGTGELGGEYSFSVLLDDQKVLAGLVRKGTPAAAALKVPLTQLVPGRSSLLAVTRDYERPGRLYYTLDLRYMTPAKEIEALNRGIAVSHTYTALGDPSTSVTRVKVGDIVRVTVTVLASADRSYVNVEDLLPAGLEPVDARLKTVDPALKLKLESDRTQAAQRQVGGYVAPWFRWYYSPWQQVDLRDDRAVLQADRLPKGVYEYVYYARATTPGDFFVVPAHAKETYFPEVFGRSDSGRFIVVP